MGLCGNLFLLNTPKSIPYHSHIHFSVNEVEASSINDLCLILET